MASRRSPRTSASSGRVTASSTASSPWPHIEALVARKGHITVGRIAPLECAAVASDHHRMLAALVRREGESFLKLMQRLDEAIQKALHEHRFTDEINSK